MTVLQVDNLSHPTTLLAEKASPSSACLLQCPDTAPLASSCPPIVVAALPTHRAVAEIALLIFPVELCTLYFICRCIMSCFINLFYSLAWEHLCRQSTMSTAPSALSFVLEKKKKHMKHRTDGRTDAKAGRGRRGGQTQENM